MGRAAVAITLSASERRELTVWLAAARRPKRRARILAAADGLENKAIVEQVGADANTVGEVVRRRFAGIGSRPLLDEPRSGFPGKIGEVEEIIGLTLGDAAGWHLEMARCPGYAPSTIHIGRQSG